MSGDVQVLGVIVIALLLVVLAVLFSMVEER